MTSISPLLSLLLALPLSLSLTAFIHAGCDDEAGEIHMARNCGRPLANYQKKLRPTPSRLSLEVDPSSVKTSSETVNEASTLIIAF